MAADGSSAAPRLIATAHRAAYSVLLAVARDPRREHQQGAQDMWTHALIRDPADFHCAVGGGESCRHCCHGIVSTS
ncbi:hypothetical protein [Saccharopolyspora sp. NPDC002376]